MSANDPRFLEDGIELSFTVAEKMDDVIERMHNEQMIELATGAAAALSTGNLIALAVMIKKIIEFMLSGDDHVNKALVSLQRQLDEMKTIVTLLSSRIDAAVIDQAQSDVKHALDRLQAALVAVRKLQVKLADRPNDPNVTVEVANEAGIEADTFLANNFDMWRWTDVVVKTVPLQNPPPHMEPTQQILAPSKNRFKNAPTLPVYIQAVMTWLAAREAAVTLGQRGRLVDDQARLRRHLVATSERPGFDKYTVLDIEGSESILEHIKWRIRALVVASDRFVKRDGTCGFYFELGSLMTGKHYSGPTFEVLMPAGAELCSLESRRVGSPDEEIELENISGAAALTELSVLLGRLVAGGSFEPPFVGRFDDAEVYPPLTFYSTDLVNADLYWHQLRSANRPGGSRDWNEPARVGYNWAAFSRVFSGGGAAIYGIDRAGDLLWYGHDGAMEGVEAWREPRKVGNGWAHFTHVFSTGEHVVYGVLPDGRLHWYRHDGAAAGEGVETWAHAAGIANGFGAYSKVFSHSRGVIYGLRADGVLERRVHKGYLTGAADWGPVEAIGTGWQSFHDVVAGPDGVLLGFTHDRRVLWYRYGRRSLVGPRLDGHQGDVISPRHRDESGQGRERWEGPVEIRQQFPAFRTVFALTPGVLRGPN
jgi:hypothetical protein